MGMGRIIGGHLCKSSITLALITFVQSGIWKCEEKIFMVEINRLSKNLEMGKNMKDSS